MNARSAFGMRTWTRWAWRIMPTICDGSRWAEVKCFAPWGCRTGRWKNGVCDGKQLVARGYTRHAFVDADGRVVRPPAFLTEVLAAARAGKEAGK